MFFLSNEKKISSNRVAKTIDLLLSVGPSCSGGTNNWNGAQDSTMDRMSCSKYKQTVQEMCFLFGNTEFVLSLLGVLPSLFPAGYHGFWRNT
jgi:hypothetical protein